MSEDQTTYETQAIDERGGLPSASLLPTLALCRGKWNAIQALPKVEREKSNADADEGTARHTLLETGSEEYSDDGQRKAVERARALLEIAKISIGLEDSIPDDIITEERLWYFDSTKTKIFSGKYDRLEIYGGIGFLPDYKMMFSDYGHAKDSLQLAANAVLVCEKYNLDTVYVALIQPCLSKDKQLTIATYTRDMLTLIALEIEVLIAEAMESTAKRTAGIKQCKYCPAKSSCPEAQANALVTLEEALTGQSCGIMTSPVTSDELDKIEYVNSVWGEYVKQRKAKAKEMLESNPNALPGYFLKNTGSTYDITDLTMARQLVHEMSDEFFNTALSLSFSELSKGYKKVVLCKNDKEARELLATRLAPILKIKEKEKSLAKR